MSSVNIAESYSSAPTIAMERMDKSLLGRRSPLFDHKVGLIEPPATVERFSTARQKVIEQWMHMTDRYPKGLHDMLDLMDPKKIGEHGYEIFGTTTTDALIIDHKVLPHKTGSLGIWRCGFVHDPSGWQGGAKELGPNLISIPLYFEEQYGGERTPNDLLRTIIYGQEPKPALIVPNNLIMGTPDLDTAGDIGMILAYYAGLSSLANKLDYYASNSWTRFNVDWMQVKQEVWGIIEKVYIPTLAHLGKLINGYRETMEITIRNNGTFDMFEYMAARFSTAQLMATAYMMVPLEGIEHQKDEAELHRERVNHRLQVGAMALGLANFILQSSRQIDD